ncbi:MAG: PAS domain-containing protein, partial [Anaeromyxobacteraceae bacterium]
MNRKRESRRGGRARPALAGRELLEAFLEWPVAAAVCDGDRVIAANHRFARALGRDASACVGLALAELLPPEDGDLVLPGVGEASAYRARLDGVVANVDLSGSSAGHRRLVAVAG